MGCMGIGMVKLEFMVVLATVSVISIVYDVINPFCRVSTGGLASRTIFVCCMLKILTLCGVPVGAKNDTYIDREIIEFNIYCQAFTTVEIRLFPLLKGQKRGGKRYV